MKHVLLQLNVILLPLDIMFQAQHASTPVRQGHLTSIAQHVLLPLNALVAHQDITFQARPVFHAHPLAPNALILLPIALPAKLALRSQELHALVLHLA